MFCLCTLKGLSNNEIRHGVHGKLLEIALEIRSPEYVENRLWATRNEGLEKVGGRWVSQKRSKVVAGFGHKGGVVVCKIRG